MAFQFCLASQSPRRKALLNKAGFHFTVEPPQNFKEKKIIELKKDLIFNSQQKALNVNSPLLVLGSDTIVLCKSQVLEKPKSRQEAKTFLSLVSGTYHQVFSSISFIKDSKVLESHLIETEVLFEKIDSKEMEYYLSLEEWKDKAGAISIQGYAGFWAQKISGSYSNIIGLPMTKTKEVLRKYGIFPNLEKRK